MFEQENVLSANACIACTVRSTHRKNLHAKPLQAALGGPIGHDAGQPTPNIRGYRDEETAYLWTSYLAQILTNQGWIPIAESMQRDRVVEFAERLARAADVKILND